MNHTLKQVALARRRLAANQFMETLLWMLTIALGAAAIGVAASKWVWPPYSGGISHGLAFWHVTWTAGGAAVALAAAVCWTWCRRRSLVSAALEVDHRFCLKERLSSALAMTPEEAQTPFGQALISDAENHALRIDIRDEFQLRPAHRIWWPFIPALIIIGLLFVPNAEQRNIAAVTNTAFEHQVTNPAVEDIKKTLDERIKQLDEKGLADLAEELRITAKKLDHLHADDEGLRKEALIKLNDVRRRVEDQRKEIGDARELKNELDRLKDLAQGPAEKLSKAMADNNFAEAKALALELARKLRDGELSEAEQQQLAKDLRNLAQEIEQMTKRHAENKERLQEQIKEALQRGDLNQADALQQQLDQAKKQDDLMQQMQQMADKMQQCAGECEQGQHLPDQNNQRSDNRSDQGRQDASQAMDDLAEIMNQIQGDQELMEALENLEQDLQACKGGCPENQDSGQQGSPHQQDWGRGEGIGGGRPDPPPNDIGSFRMRVDGQVQRGETIVTGNADGLNIAGKSLEEVRAGVQAEMSQYSDPLDDQRLHRSQREHARQYFERLRDGD
ncbi:MAG TPA: hypothetical protein PKD54_12350 [Pirellulaceae bacterium]|nr:hypothetical protein [Pirellulaceae bacterium]